MVKRYRVSNRLLIVGKDAPDVFDLTNLDVVLHSDYAALEARCLLAEKDRDTLLTMTGTTIEQVAARIRSAQETKGDASGR
jgi:hypothetical protein